MVTSGNVLLEALNDIRFQAYELNMTEVHALLELACDALASKVFGDVNAARPERAELASFALSLAGPPPQWVEKSHSNMPEIIALLRANGYRWFREDGTNIIYVDFGKEEAPILAEVYD